MSTQPGYEIVPSQPPPQTCSGVLQQSGILPKPVGEAPGNVPSMPIHMARAQMIGSFVISSDNVPGTEQVVSTYDGYPTPMVPFIAGTRSALSGAGFPYTAQFYFHQSIYWNADVNLHFWAVKPPSAVGRLRIVFTPAEIDPLADTAQREITKEWDMSLTNLFEFQVPSYNLRSYKNCVANCAPLNGLTSTYQTPACHYKLGRIRVYVTHIYQPGSVFPSSCNCYVFQSFSKPQFAIAAAPGVPMERTALTPLTTLT